MVPAVHHVPAPVHGAATQRSPANSPLRDATPGVKEGVAPGGAAPSSPDEDLATRPGTRRSRRRCRRRRSRRDREAVGAGEHERPDVGPAVAVHSVTAAPTFIGAAAAAAGAGFRCCRSGSTTQRRLLMARSWRRQSGLAGIRALAAVSIAERIERGTARVGLVDVATMLGGEGPAAAEVPRLSATSDVVTPKRRDGFVVPFKVIGGSASVLQGRPDGTSCAGATHHQRPTTDLVGHRLVDRRRADDDVIVAGSAVSRVASEAVKVNVTAGGTGRIVGQRGRPVASTVVFVMVRR